MRLCTQLASSTTGKIAVLDPRITALKKTSSAITTLSPTTAKSNKSSTTYLGEATVVRVWLDTDGFSGLGLQVVPLEAAAFTNLV